MLWFVVLDDIDSPHFINRESLISRNRRGCGNVERIGKRDKKGLAFGK